MQSFKIKTGKLGNQNSYDLTTDKSQPVCTIETSKMNRLFEIARS